MERKRKREWVDEKTKKTWEERNLITFNPYYNYEFDMDDQIDQILKTDCPWIINIVTCDFCFKKDWECMDYRIKPTKPKTKLEILSYYHVENLFSIDPTSKMRLEMVNCHDCKQELMKIGKSLIIEREKQLQLCYLDVSIKFK